VYIVLRWNEHRQELGLQLITHDTDHLVIGTTRILRTLANKVHFENPLIISQQSVIQLVHLKHDLTIDGEQAFRVDAPSVSENCRFSTVNRDLLLS
jgi:hypothetical protein